MTNDQDPGISQDEKEILEELMNIAFGSASAELGEVLDIHVHLNVPEIKILSIETVPDYLDQAKTADTGIDIIEQNFWGDFTGRSFLSISNCDSEDLLHLIDPTAPEDDYDTQDLEIKHRGVLLEIANIMIGACIGKIAEMLETIVTYSPPILTGRDLQYLLHESYDQSMKAIVLKTVFSFENKAINGFLLTITSPASIAWIKTALANFMENYE